MPKRERRTEEDAPFTFHAPGREAGHAGPRAVRLEHLLFEEIDRLFRLEVSDPRLQGVTPTSLQLSPDLRNAKIMYGLKETKNGGKGQTPAQHERQVHEGLLRVTPFLRARVAEALAIKRTPDLHFHRDRMAEASLRAAALLTSEKGLSDG